MKLLFDKGYNNIINESESIQQIKEKNCYALDFEEEIKKNLIEKNYELPGKNFFLLNFGTLTFE
jgi:hypothetical protein